MHSQFFRYNEVHINTPTLNKTLLVLRLPLDSNFVLLLHVNTAACLGLSSWIWNSGLASWKHTFSKCGTLLSDFSVTISIFLIFILQTNSCSNWRLSIKQSDEAFFCNIGPYCFITWKQNNACCLSAFTLDWHSFSNYISWVFSAHFNRGSLNYWRGTHF